MLDYGDLGMMPGVGQAVATTGTWTKAALVCKQLGPHLQEVPVSALLFENV